MPGAQPKSNWITSPQAATTTSTTCSITWAPLCPDLSHLTRPGFTLPLVTTLPTASLPCLLSKFCLFLKVQIKQKSPFGFALLSLGSYHSLGPNYYLCAAWTRGFTIRGIFSTVIINVAQTTWSCPKNATCRLWEREHIKQPKPQFPHLLNRDSSHACCFGSVRRFSEIQKHPMERWAWDLTSTKTLRSHC